MTPEDETALGIFLVIFFFAIIFICYVINSNIKESNETNERFLRKLTDILENMNKKMDKSDKDMQDTIKKINENLEEINKNLQGTNKNFSKKKE